MKKIIINIGFNDYNFLDGEHLKKEWIDKRMAIFRKFTLQSLKKQTNQNFLALIRYEDSTESLIKHALNSYEMLPDNIRFVPKKLHASAMLEELKQGGEEDFYLVRIDSDDMYHKNYIQKLHDYTAAEGTQVLLNQKGYIYDDVNNRVGTYFCQSPPFYVFVYKTQDFIKGYRHKITASGHQGVIGMPHEILPGRNFMVVIHSNNTGTLFHFNLEKTIDDPLEAEKVLQDFM